MARTPLIKKTARKAPRSAALAREPRDMVAFLRNLPEVLAGGLVGQDSATATIVRALEQKLLCAVDSYRPRAALIFLGPHGVGKTHAVRNLARAYTGTGAEPLFLNFAAREKTEIRPLLAQLTAAVLETPRRVIHVVNIESAATDTVDYFVRLLDEGTLRDQTRALVSFRECLFVFETNVGGDLIAHAGYPPSQLYKFAFEALRDSLPLPLVRRADDLVLFHRLHSRHLHRIMEQFAVETGRNCLAGGVGFRVTEEATRWIIDRTDLSEGVPALRRNFEIYAGRPLAEWILKSSLVSGHTLQLGLAEGGVGLKVEELEARVPVR
ncbi:MAG: AAA family ATPase [Verrucomicrobiae bacterium]|nr:AAA family ATPase [Verrucomicrobiae bacterium]